MCIVAIDGDNLKDIEHRGMNEREGDPEAEWACLFLVLIRMGFQGDLKRSALVVGQDYRTVRTGWTCFVPDL